MSSTGQLAQWIETLYGVLVRTNFIVGFLILVGLVVFVGHYRSREAKARVGSRRWHLPISELLWSSLPFAILLGVFVWGWR